MKQPSVAASCIISFCRTEHFCAVFRSDAAATSTATVTPPSGAKPLENFPRVCRSRRRRLIRGAFKVVFFIEKLQMKRMPQKWFHLSANEAFADPVSKLRSNKLQPANTNEICLPTAKQVGPGKTGFHGQEPPTLRLAVGKIYIWLSWPHPGPAEAPLSKPLSPGTLYQRKALCLFTSGQRLRLLSGRKRFRGLSNFQISEFSEQKLQKLHQNNHPAQLLTPPKTLHIHTGVGGITEKCKSAEGQTQQLLINTVNKERR